MIKPLLLAFGVAGMLSSTAQAQTTPAMGSRAASTSATSKTSQSNSGDMAPNRSSTAGTSAAATSNNPVDATGKPVNTTPSNTTSTVKKQPSKK